MLSSESYPAQAESVGPLTTNPELLGAVPTPLGQLLSIPAPPMLGHLQVPLPQALPQGGHPGLLAHGPGAVLGKKEGKQKKKKKMK